MKARSKILSVIVLLALLLGALPVGGILFAAPAEQRVQFTAPVVIANTSFLNVRTGPGIGYAVLITVTGGSALPVLAISEDRAWYQVTTIVGVGWVNMQYVLPRGDFSNVPFGQTPAIVDPRSGGIPGTGGMGMPGTSFPGTGSMGDDSYDIGYSSGREWGISLILDHPLRSGPTINSLEITPLTIDRSTIYTVLASTYAEGQEWYQVNTGQYTGWVEGPKVAFRPFACELSAVVATQDVPLRTGPDGVGPNGDVYIAAGYEAYLLDQLGDLFKIELVDGTVGWVGISAFQVRQRDEVTSAYCESGGAAARAGAQTGGSGLPGTGGMGSSLTPGVALGSIPRVVINTGFLNVRSGPGAQYTTVATLAGGTELAVLGIAPDNVWYLVQGTFGQGWVNNEFTLFRGDGSRLPIIRAATGQVATPLGTLNRPNVTLYAAPNLTLGSLGVLPGGEYQVVARTGDFTWVQISTPLGFGWVQAAYINIIGDTGLIPVIG